MKQLCLRLSKSVLVLVSACVLCTASLAGQNTDHIEPSAFENLTPTAEQVAKSTGLLPLLQDLRQSLKTPDTANPWRALYLRQQILEGVTSASLQVDATTARIDSEIAQASEFRSFLSDKRDRQENKLNLASIGTGGALSVVSSALQLSAKHAKAGNSVGIGAGVIVTVLSVMSLRAQNGKAGEFQFRSNMLAELFHRPADDTDIYSPAVLAFLDAVPAVDPDKLSRRRRLLKTWVDMGRLDALDTPSGQKKIDRMTGNFASDYKLTIDDLYDRRAMLEDLRAKLTLMKRDLAAFLSALPQAQPPQAAR